MKKVLEQLIINSPMKMITYAEYINTALYHPEQGYYMKDELKIGRKGDFITTSNVSDIYGKMIAKWYAANHKSLNLPAAVCEIGGGNGRFAQAFLEGWSKLTPYPLSYSLIETSPFHRKLQAEALKEFSNVTQYKEIKDLIGFKGLVFSNELFDALPVHVIEKRHGALYEVMVTISKGKFSEVLTPLENKQIIAFVHKHEIKLREGQRIEIPLEMEDVVSAIEQLLSKGIVITVDYGYTKEEWTEPSRRNGSLRGYYRQQMYEDILEYPGIMDITSHVHFDVLIEQGAKQGLEFILKLRQDELFLRMGILEELTSNYDPNPFSEKSKQNRAIKSLVLPGGISSSFHVIIQGKGIKIKGNELFLKDKKAME